jgi:hypothetical protein
LYQLFRTLLILFLGVSTLHAEPQTGPKVDPFDLTLNLQFQEDGKNIEGNLEKRIEGVQATFQCLPPKAKNYVCAWADPADVGLSSFFRSVLISVPELMLPQDVTNPKWCYLALHLIVKSRFGYFLFDDSTRTQYVATWNPNGPEERRGLKLILWPPPRDNSEKRTPGEWIADPTLAATIMRKWNNKTLRVSCGPNGCEAFLF